MSDQMLSRMTENVKDAVKQSEVIAKNLKLLKDVGGQVGTLETDYNNLVIKINKQREALKLRGISI